MSLVGLDYGRFEDAQATFTGRGRRIEWQARRDGDVWHWRTRDMRGWRRFVLTFWGIGDEAEMFAAYRAACASVGISAPTEPRKDRP